jgi:hypothetical protein
MVPLSGYGGNKYTRTPALQRSLKTVSALSLAEKHLHAGRPTGEIPPPDTHCAGIARIHLLLSGGHQMKRSFAVLALAAGLAFSACADGEEEADVVEQAPPPAAPAPAPTDTILTTTTDTVAHTTTH